MALLRTPLPASLSIKKGLEEINLGKFFLLTEKACFRIFIFKRDFGSFPCGRWQALNFVHNCLHDIYIIESEMPVNWVVLLSPIWLHNLPSTTCGFFDTHFGLCISSCVYRWHFDSLAQLFSPCNLCRLSL